MKRLVLIGIALVGSLVMVAQQTYPPYTIEYVLGYPLPNAINGTQHLTALERVILSAPEGVGESFVLEADVDHRIEVYLDNQHVIFNMNDVYSDFPDPDDAYILDTSLPVGSFDGSYSANPNGSMSYTMPIDLPAGINGIVPSLGLSYNSYGSNGLLGQGWNLNAGQSSISRATRSYYSNGVTRAIDLTKDDNLQLDGVRLIHVEGTYGEDGCVFKLENNPHDYIVVHDGDNGEADKWYELFQSNGNRVIYGQSHNARFMTDDFEACLMWRIEKVIDQFGNSIDYIYSNEGRTPRLLDIVYTSNENQGVDIRLIPCIIFKLIGALEDEK